MSNDSIDVHQYKVLLYLLDFRENRYLLLLTENYSALKILQQTDLTDRDPVILFGSSFPEDINYTQVISMFTCIELLNIMQCICFH